MMKQKFTALLLALVAFIGGANAALTYTLHVTQGKTLSTEDLQALTVLQAQSVITITESGSNKVFKNSSSTTLFSYNTSTEKCDLPVSTTSANSISASITLVGNTYLGLAPLLYLHDPRYTAISLTFPDPQVYVEHSNNSLTFRYDHNKSNYGRTYSLNTGSNSPAWYSSRESITWVNFDATFANARPTTCYQWFYGMTSLTSISGLSNLNTSQVTNMGSMFDNCIGLSNITGVSNLNTANVTNMEAMFRNCVNLGSLNLSSWNTAKVTNMAYMFMGDVSLTNLTISSWNTAKVTNMRSMFNSCRGLRQLELGNWNVASVTTTTNIFKYCTGLESLSLSATLVTKIEDGSFTGVGTASNPCSLYYPTSSHLTFTEMTDTYAKWKDGYFDCRNLTVYVYLENNTLTFCFDDFYAERLYNSTVYDLNTGATQPDWISQSSNITSVVINPTFANTRPTSCYRWFYNMPEVTYISGLNYLNTSEVTNMCEMFRGSFKGTSSSLSVDHFNTSKVTDMRNMFYSCSGLTYLNVTNFNVEKVTDMRNMFNGCAKLTEIDLGNFNTQIDSSKVLNIVKYCKSLKYLILSESMVDRINFDGCTGIGTASNPCELHYPTSAHPTFSEVTNTYVKWKEGYFASQNLKVYVYLNNNTLTFCYDDYYATRQASSTVYNLNTGTNLPGWYNSRESIYNVVINPTFANARPTSCYRWFYGMKNLISLSGEQYLNTSEVTNMREMFSGSYQYVSASPKVNNFNTSKVTDMYGMFYNCIGIWHLDVSNFNIQNVTDMRNMFRGCGELRELDLSNFNTQIDASKVSGIVKNCEGLTTLSLSASLLAKIEADGCAGIGTRMSPCTLVYPEGYPLDKGETCVAWFRWRNGYFTDGIPLGDVNDDGDITIADASALMKIVLGKDTAGLYNHSVADTNGDGKITIADVTTVVNHILWKDR